jgi:hypothetical protein
MEFKRGILPGCFIAGRARHYHNELTYRELVLHPIVCLISLADGSTSGNVLQILFNFSKLLLILMA